MNPNITELHKEIGKEEQFNTIGSRATTKYSQSFQKYFSSNESNGQSPLDLFKKTKSQIKQWKSEREIKTLNNQAFSVQQRKNLKHFYELFNELTEEKRNIFKELQRVDETSVTSNLEESSSTPRADLQAIKNALRMMSWENSKLRLQKNQQVQQRSSPPAQIVDDWGDWNTKHPFYHFFDSKETFQKELSTLNQKFQSAYQLASSAQLLNHDFGNLGPQVSEHFREQQQEASKQISNVSVDIESHIVSRLLEWMGKS